MGRLLGLVVALATCAACGSESGARVVEQRPPADAAPAEPVVTIPLRPLGKPTLEAYAWRKGPGKAGFDRALAAEKSGDLAAIEAACQDALAADPGHLEAAWMLAVARARQGKLDQVLAPLEVAAAGDWAKWGERSLDLPLFAAFRATPTGKGWLAAAEGYRAALATALRDAAIVVGRTAPYRRPRGDGEVRVDHKAELYAAAGDRWIRLTRTGGAVAAALPARGHPVVAYVAYRELVRPRVGGATIRELRVGAVDLTTGRTGREVTLRDVHQATLAWVERGSEPTLVVEVVPARTGPQASKPRTYAVDWRQGGPGSRRARARRGR